KALYFVNQALKTARKNGAAKHEAIALSVKAGIVHEKRPKMARSYLEQARKLSAKMGAQPLLQKISGTMKDFANP
ncbi:MAG TPA: hypothetical protein HPP58_07150, partial [Deltaproteobacteria bacterium]|nr:hypothetical protein [Deltaproteobacteria bacterium]